MNIIESSWDACKNVIMIRNNHSIIKFRAKSAQEKKVDKYWKELIEETRMRVRAIYW